MAAMEGGVNFKKLNAAIMGDGAEYYVASQIMLKLKYIVSLAPTAAPGWDLEVTNPQNGRSARVQVKYKTSSESDSSHLRLRGGVGFDFIVLVENCVRATIQTDQSGSKERLMNSYWMEAYPAWVISMDDAKSLIYQSKNKDKGFMIKNFRSRETLYDWEALYRYLD